MPRSGPSSASPKNRKTEPSTHSDTSAPSGNESPPAISNEQQSHDSAEAPLANSSDDENSPPNQRAVIDSRENGNSPESDSDEAPEVVSIVAGKRQIKQREEEIDKFAKATARARRQANRARDEKLKQNCKPRKTNIKTSEKDQVGSEESSSSDEDTEDNTSSTPASAPIPINTKKYLDPSLFASASDSLDKSKQASHARALEKSKLLATRRKKHKKIQSQDWKDLGFAQLPLHTPSALRHDHVFRTDLIIANFACLGFVLSNNTTVVHLPQTDHLNPSPRPVAAANFARNRMYTKPSRSAVKLPRATLAAKAEMGARKSAVETTYSRRAHKPALVFARSQD